MDSKESHEEIKKKIKNGEYGLFDKILYGGLGYGYFCIPSDVFKWIFTGIFPPIGIFIHYFGKLSKKFPYITAQNLKNLVSHIDEFIIAFLGTMLFYVPGLMYVINIFNKSASTSENLEDNKEKYENTSNKEDKKKEYNADDDDDDDDDDYDDDDEDYAPTNLDNLRETLFND